jgi:multidrug efflux pump subunit AcrB
MNIAEFSINKKVITLTLTALLIVAGIKSFDSLSRLEDPEFTIKEAIVITKYPGASAAEVAEEVTNVIEKACQEMGQLDFIESTSKRGFSQVKVVIKDKYDKASLPQVWDELRRKINDNQRFLPPGAGPSLVNDDFGDVYGVYFALTGEGYTDKEIYDVADFLKRELLLAQDVKKIVMYGVQPEVIYVEMARQKMAELGISQYDIYNALQAKNLPVDSGMMKLGQEYIPINPTGEFRSEKEFGDLLISGKDPNRLIYLKDVASVVRGYKDPPDTILRFNGKPAIGIGISTVMGGNVVTMGEAIDKRLKELKSQIPVGMELGIISLQSESTTNAIDGFLVNLVQAVAIVVVVLVLFMGIQSALIIGFILILTIISTFIFMGQMGVALERISLGALIIALGMLVDNAIVIIDGMKVKIEQGIDGTKAASDVVGQTSIPLLGATAVAIIAFAAIGTSQDSTGEYCRSLFQVILISLSMSWVTAVTVAPLLGVMFLKKKSGSKEAADPYAGNMYQAYKKALISSLRSRWVTVGAVAAIFLIALFGFKFVDQMFFPNSTRPQFMIDIWYPEGTHINKVSRELKKAEEYLMGIDHVTDITTQLGGGQMRILLTYTPEPSSYSYGQIFVSVDDYRLVDTMMPGVYKKMAELFPDAKIGLKKFLLGPGDGGKIQLRVMGPDGDKLRELAEKAKNIIYKDGGAVAIRDEWREKVKVVRPQLAEAQARRTGITRPDLGKALESAFSGTQTGVYREGDDLIPIVARSPEEERLDAGNIRDLQIWSPAAQKMIPMRQIAPNVKTEFEDTSMWRRDRQYQLKIHADPKGGLASDLLARVKPKIEKALDVDVGQVLGKRFGPGQDPFKNFTHKTLPIIYKNQMPLKGMPGYSMGWDGEAESSAKAQVSLAGKMPVFVTLMFLIVVCLFNAFRQPLVIWCCVPLALIGVTAGLLLTGQPFGFMALLGLISLSGMLIKNAIVLIDQIDLEIKSGKGHYQSIIDSGVSRLRPVLMAAVTTIFGMVPLFKDAFFISMAVTIVFGLAFATVLTMVVVPVLYAIFFKISDKKEV